VSSGLFALLDDVAAIAKVAAASVDDVMAQAAKAGSKAAGIVIDDAAVTPRYAVGFAADRELPIIWKIALGSFKNKLLFLLPGALLLAFIAPWSITPLLMIGGVYLCYEGAEKILELVVPHAHHADEHEAGEAILDAKQLENDKIAGAIKTDFILSAEIMAITLASVSTASFLTQAVVLALVGIGITVAVYGVVALIVKADDAGVALAANERPITSLYNLVVRRTLAADAKPPRGADRALRPLTQGLGRGLVIGMPYFLSVLSGIGTAAMLWVGGGIIIHGFEGYGFGWLGHLIHDLGAAAGRAVPVIGGAVEWFVGAGLAALCGLVIGGIAIVAMHFIVSPLMKTFRPARS
jgi:predicted DNA repair protein MutK